MFFPEFSEISENIFFPEHLRVTASDIHIQVVAIYNLNLSLQFLTKNIFLLWLFTQEHSLMLLNFFVDLIFGWVILYHALQDRF